MPTITTIHLDETEENFKRYEILGNPGLREIQELQKINIFVGPNNEGKSHFVRSLSKAAVNNFLIDNVGLSELQKDLQAFDDQFERTASSHPAIHVVTTDKLLKKVSGKNILDIRRKMEEQFAFFHDFISQSYLNEVAINQVKDILQTFDLLKRENIIVQGQGTGYDNTSKPNFQKDLRDLLDKNSSLIERLEKIASFPIHPDKFKKIYIPVLRGLYCFDEYTKNTEVDFLADRISEQYGYKKGSYNVEIFTGQTLYTKFNEMLRTTEEARKKKKEYEEFLSKEFFEEQKVEITPTLNKNKQNKNDERIVSVKIGESPERKIYELGDGIQSLIILTFTAFEYDNALFFIEEPELNLHPGMQRRYINFLLNHEANQNHQYFLSTQSNHFLDITFDYKNISIFSVNRKNTGEEKFTIECLGAGDRTILDFLGVNNSSVFLSNSTVWVEGITDRLYIRKFLELYQEKKKAKDDSFEEIREDSDFSFVEYSGSNITHWSFLEDEDEPLGIDVEKLCGKLFLISDQSDREGLKEREEKLKEKLGDRYYPLNCFEIENILSLQTIERVLKSQRFEAKQFPMPKFSSAYPHKDVKFGKFIDEEIFKKIKDYNSEKVYSEKSGSLKSGYKIKFCKEAVDKMSYEEMTDLARELAEKIYNFVLAEKN